jgi:acyl carrier protein
MMEKREIESLVNHFLTEDMEIETDKITEEARLREDLGLDSLDFVDIVVVVERTFGFKIKPEEMGNVLTVKDFYNYIDAKVNA